jgi:hypothetical protein
MGRLKGKHAEVRERGEDLLKLTLCLGVVQGVPEDASRQGAGVAPVFEQHLAVDNGVVNTGGEFPRQWGDGVSIENCDVSLQARKDTPSSGPVVNTLGMS